MLKLYINIKNFHAGHLWLKSQEPKACCTESHIRHEERDCLLCEDGNNKHISLVHNMTLQYNLKQQWYMRELLQ
jgi:hypothetical protein